MRTASGPPAASARSPASIQLLRGVLVTVGIISLYLVHPALTSSFSIHTVLYCMDQCDSLRRKLHERTDRNRSRSGHGPNDSRVRREGASDRSAADRAS